MAEQTTYPMMSEKSWWILRDKFKASLPTSFGATFVKSLLLLSSDASANNNIIVPMKRLGLIDDDNKPTALANDWRIDDKYQSTCEAIVKAVYSQELLDLFPNTNVDRTIAKNWFMIGDCETPSPPFTKRTNPGSAEPPLSKAKGESETCHAECPPAVEGRTPFI